ncbi:ferredoxin [Cryobacterium sp. TMS1-20-1]|uniref:ferredoxin n=1 Tax=Cryobacterium sp. TMS1-20-1 TaxID=1259223 RepID=UPI00106A5EC1|nr:ferredoxin [Cryobacterium sp. TMS1-20-1]
MKVTIDSDRCVGHGMCNMYASELFHLNDEGHAFVDGPDVPPGLEAVARLGSSACPDRAITRGVTRQ